MRISYVDIFQNPNLDKFVSHLSYYSCVVVRLWACGRRSYATISRSSERSNQRSSRSSDQQAGRSGPGGGVSIDEPRLTDGGLALALALALALGGSALLFLFLAVGFTFVLARPVPLHCSPPSQWPPRRPLSCPSSRSPSSSSFPPYPLQVPTRSSFPTLPRRHFVLSPSSSAYSVRCLPPFCILRFSDSPQAFLYYRFVPQGG